MKKLLYIAGVVIALMAALVLLNNAYMIRDNSEAIAVESGDVAFVFKCNGADLIFVPASATATAQYNSSGVIEIVGNIVIGSPAAGPGGAGAGTITPAASGESASKAGWGYVIFGNPKIGHIYSCQNSTANASDLNWKQGTGGDNTDLDLAAAATGTHTEGGFSTLISGSYVLINGNKAKEANKPFFIWADDTDFEIMMRGNLDTSVDGTTGETENAKFQSAPKTI